MQCGGPKKIMGCGANTTWCDLGHPKFHWTGGSGRENKATKGQKLKRKEKSVVGNELVGERLWGTHGGKRRQRTGWWEKRRFENSEH